MAIKMVFNPRLNAFQDVDESVSNSISDAIVSAQAQINAGKTKVSVFDPGVGAYREMKKNDAVVYIEKANNGKKKEDKDKENKDHNKKENENKGADVPALGEVVKVGIVDNGNGKNNTNIKK